MHYAKYFPYLSVSHVMFLIFRSLYLLLARLPEASPPRKTSYREFPYEQTKTSAEDMDKPPSRPNVSWYL